MTTNAAITYRWSALARALQVSARAWRVVLPVVAVNALLQAALIAAVLHPELTVGFAILALLSYALIASSYVIVTAALLGVIDGRGEPRISWVLKGSRSRFLPAALWSLALVLVVTIGLSVYLIPGLVVIGLFPFLLIAVVDGRRNPVVVNFTVIRARVWRWLLTLVLLGVITGVLWLLATVNAFFITGPPGALIAWLGYGLIGTWFTAAWALIYRSVVGR